MELLAQTLGTKPDLVVQPTSRAAVGFPELLQLLVAVGIVLALLKWLMPKALEKLNRRVGSPTGGSLAVEESLSLGTTQLHVVRVGEKRLLLASGSSGVQCLTDLGVDETPESKDAPTFFEMVDEKKDSSAPDLKVVEADPLVEEALEQRMKARGAFRQAVVQPRTEAATDLLERLTRLTG